MMPATRSCVRGRGDGRRLTRRSMLVASKMPIMMEKLRSPSTSLSKITCCSWISLMIIRFSSMWTGTAASLSADATAVAGASRPAAAPEYGL